MPFTADEIDSIRADAFANDVLYDLATLAPLTEEQIVEYFESGGESLPEGVVMPKLKKKKKKKSAEEKQAEEEAKKDVLPAIDSAGARRIICLHAAGSCGEIMRRQMKKLEMDGKFEEMVYLDGLVPVDASAHPDSKALKAFYPTCSNVQYMEEREVHRGTREERARTLNYTRKEDRALWEIHRDRDDPGPWEMYHVGVEGALEQLSCALASGKIPAKETGIVSIGQGNNLLMMLLALLDAANDGDAAHRRRARIMPGRCLLFHPVDDWVERFVKECEARGLGWRCIEAIDKGIRKADGIADVTTDMEALDVSDAATTLAAPMKMRPIFGTSLRVPSLIVFGEADYHFEQVKKCIPRFESVKTMMSIELGFKIPQDDKYGKEFVEHMRYRAEGEKEPEPPQPAPVYSPSGW